MKSKITLRELARVLNVSPSTVSKSLSDSHEISVATRKRVKEVATTLSYKPNYFASNLRKGTPKVIGVILPTILNPYYAKLLTEIEVVLRENGYKMLTMFSNHSKDKELQCMTQLDDGSVEGMVICEAKNTQLYKSKHHPTEWNIRKTPKVYIDRVDDSLKKDPLAFEQNVRDLCRQVITELLQKISTGFQKTNRIE